MLEGKGDLKRRITSIARFDARITGSILLALILLVVIGVLAFTDRNKPLIESFGTTRPTTRPVPLDQKTPTIDGHRATSKADLAMKNALDRHVPEVRLDNVALSDVFDFLRDVSGADIFINWRTLETVGIKKSAPVSARMREVKVSKVLRTILADASGGNVKLGYMIENGKIIVTTADELKKNTVVAVYDIRDLLSPLPPPPEEMPPAFPLLNRAGADGKTTINDFVTDAHAAQLVKTVTDLIKETVDRESLIENGGKFSSLKYLSGQLIITQTEENQRQIVALLDKLRETRSIWEIIEAKFITVEAASVEEVLKAADLKLEPTKEQFKGQLKDNLRIEFLDEEQVNKLVRAAKAYKDSTVHATPRITVLNGQNGSITVAQQQAYISGYKEDKRPDGTRKFNPITDTIQSGVLMDVQATASADRKYITLGVDARVSQLKSLTNVPFEPAAPGEKLMIQKPDVTEIKAKTIVSIPDGGNLLLIPDIKKPMEDEGKKWNLLILVKSTLIVAGH